MIKHLLSIAIITLFISFSASAERLEVPIVKTGDPIEVELDDGSIITIDASSDDAEQENNEMDAIYDDDIDFGWEGEPDDQNILAAGLRFQNITIPQGATIDAAYIEFVSHEAKTADDVAIINIYGEANDNPATYDLESLVTDRPKTTAKVVWTVNEAWDLWGTYYSADIRIIIQELVNRPGWQSGNSMAFMLVGENQGPSDLENAREVESFENIADPEDGGDGKNHPERVPKLIIEYTVDNPVKTLEIPIVKNGDPIEVELDDGSIITIDASSDDAEQENNEMDAIYDDDIDFGWEGEPDDQNILTAGLRFQNITIPQGATIEEAYIKLVSHEAKTAEDEAIITIYGEANDNPATYDLESLVTDRPKTNANVVWTVNEAWDLWGTYYSADIRIIIQELVNRPGWQSGNSMAFMLVGENQGPSDMENAREVESFENIADPEDGGDGKNHPERVPMLVIKYVETSSVENETVENANGLSVFPNPANDMINIYVDNVANFDLLIYNQIGELVVSQKVNSNEAKIDVTNLPAGAYFIEIIANDNIKTQQIIIN